MAAPPRLAVLLALLASSACATVRNYPDPAGPRFAGQFAGVERPSAIRVVSYNVKYGRNVTGLAALLGGDPRLKGADLIALQEMDEAGVECVARALGLNYVYYPAAVHPADDRNFGNAILSPWPIEDDRKIVLPHRGRWRRMQRIAVAATVRVRGDVPVRFFSVHLETPFSLGGDGRGEQARAVLESAAGHPRVVVAGDFNSRGLAGSVFARAGFRWLTEEVGRTISRFSWDHLLARGLRPRDCASVGAAPNAWKVSDHLPVWADLVLE
ncbi:MAG TPA: endonuclease/exonuclease/phosphatase family protein [Vicinamibacteria bacterium]|nr:endonuclease/exonuclease/phosphatase family protein [Vicinamibacteria bacterium]